LGNSTVDHSAGANIVIRNSFLRLLKNAMAEL